MTNDHVTFVVASPHVSVLTARELPRAMRKDKRECSDKQRWCCARRTADQVLEVSRWISEHAFDKLRAIDCTFAEFEEALTSAEAIEETVIDTDVLKVLLLVVDWIRPLHVVVVIDDRRREERVVTVYVPDDDLWSFGYRERR